MKDLGKVWYGEVRPAGVVFRKARQGSVRYCKAGFGPVGLGTLWLCVVR